MLITDFFQQVKEKRTKSQQSNREISQIENYENKFIKEKVLNQENNCPNKQVYNYSHII